MEQKTKEKIESFKIHVVDFLTAEMIENSDVRPKLFVLTFDSNENEYPLAVVEIPDYFMAGNNSKNILSQIVPQIMKQMKEMGKTPVSICFSTEAWVRETGVKTKEEVEKLDWKSLPKQEVLLLSFEDEDEVVTKTFNIERDGMKVNEQGELKDSISLTEKEGLTGIEGRFVGFFKRYKELV